MTVRNLVIVLGDQLNADSEAFTDFDRNHDTVWMAEVEEENTHVWCHKLRIAYFLSAMRHFRLLLEKKKFRVTYHQLHRDSSNDSGRSFAEVLQHDISELNPAKIIVVQPGDYRVTTQLTEAAEASGVELEIRHDQHFYCSIDEFREYAKGRKSLLLEYFYRHLRKQHDVLITDTGEPEGGKWNFDHDNRESFGKQGPGAVPAPKVFRPDATTKEVMELVENRFSSHPGKLERFTLPVTRRQATTFLKNFVDHILPDFGTYEDAMWKDESFLFHSRLSAMLNIKLLSPRQCVDMAVEAYQTGKAPLNSVEGFVRQIIGWREFVRGIYWINMPSYAELNHLNQQQELPSFFWDGDTDMQCVKQSMNHVLEHGYAHHIHRLMVLGNFALMWGADPMQFHNWHMAMYLDAIDWVSLPNTLGMSQFGDGGIVGTKPYCSSGNYINKMSNFCKYCRYNYKEKVGEDACPFTTFYWDFMDRHYDQLKSNQRMKFPIRNVEKLRQQKEVIDAVRRRAMQLRESWS